MTDSTKIIFANHEVRKTKLQKTYFIEWVTEYIKNLGYEVKIEKGPFGARNIVVGDVSKAKAIFTAHYDTCAVMPLPNFITPKSIACYLLYQLFLSVFIIALPVAVAFIVGLLEPMLMPIVTFVGIYAIVALMMFGPANKHTANDNTSGVTAVLDLLTALPEDKKGEVAFVLFDLEEAGLLGSSGFAKKHRKEIKDTPLINFDCVSDGENIIFALNRKAKSFKEQLENAYISDGKFSVEVCQKGVFYPSDQMNVPLGVGVAALKKSKKFGVLYMDKIHTKKDTVYQQDNIDFLVKGSLRFIDSIQP
ncbi:MAG: M28 family peptidase [Clostridia bacterium]|nr:M28 family peptidase [Clostridia bacterium]